MDATSVIITLVIGAIAGWLAAQLVKGSGFGLVGDIIVGIVGALIAGWLFPRIFTAINPPLLGAILAATIGAVILLVIIRLIKRA